MSDRQAERIEVVARADFGLPDGVKPNTVQEANARKILAALDAFDREHQDVWPSVDPSALGCICGASFDEPCRRVRKGMLGLGRPQPDPCRPDPQPAPEA